MEVGKRVVKWVLKSFDGRLGTILAPLKCEPQKKITSFKKWVREGNSILRLGKDYWVIPCKRSIAADWLQFLSRACLLLPILMVGSNLWIPVLNVIFQFGHNKTRLFVKKEIWHVWGTWNPRHNPMLMKSRTWCSRSIIQILSQNGFNKIFYPLCRDPNRHTPLNKILHK